MSAPRRMRVWGAGVACGHLALGLVAALALRDDGAALFFALCALVTIVLSQAIAPLLRRPPDDGDDGGGGPPPEDPEPPWWPEFEREFRAYAEDRRGTAA
jgi:hypothetical protein